LAAGDYYPAPLSKFEVAVLILEDRRFFSHWGVDPVAVVREIARAATFRKHGGASTVDMQLVRTATGYKERRLSRKLYESLLATLIQFRYSKPRILRSYLASAFFGSHLIGAETASLKLFGRFPDDLPIEESALLAAMLVYPKPTLPTDNWLVKIRRRANYAQRLYPRYEQRFKKLPRWEEI
jgi:membrane peptidoglycan carboxypeptidase